MSLELKKKELELQRAQLAKKELEFKVEERLEEVGRLKAHIILQEQKEIELKTELSKLDNGG